MTQDVLRLLRTFPSRKPLHSNRTAFPKNPKNIHLEEVFRLSCRFIHSTWSKTFFFSFGLEHILISIRRFLLLSKLQPRNITCCYHQTSLNQNLYNRLERPTIFTCGLQKNVYPLAMNGTNLVQLALYLVVALSWIAAPLILPMEIHLIKPPGH